MLPLFSKRNRFTAYCCNSRWKSRREIAWMSEKTASNQSHEYHITLCHHVCFRESLSYDISCQIHHRSTSFSSEKCRLRWCTASKETRLDRPAPGMRSFTINNIKESSDERFGISPTWFQLEPGQRKSLSVEVPPTDSGCAYTGFTFNEGSLRWSCTLYLPCGGLSGENRDVPSLNGVAGQTVGESCVAKRRLATRSGRVSRPVRKLGCCRWVLASWHRQAAARRCCYKWFAFRLACSKQPTNPNIGAPTPIPVPNTLVSKTI